MNKWTKEWMNEQTNEGMNVWMNEWKNECMKGWMNEWIFYSSILIFNIQFNKKKLVIRMSIVHTQITANDVMNAEWLCCYEWHSFIKWIPWMILIFVPSLIVGLTEYMWNWSIILLWIKPIVCLNISEHPIKNNKSINKKCSTQRQIRHIICLWFNFMQNE